MWIDEEEEEEYMDVGWMELLCVSFIAGGEEMYGGMYEEEVEQEVLCLVIIGDKVEEMVEEVEEKALIFESDHYRC